MKTISFLVTCKNETTQLEKLLSCINEYVTKNGYEDECIILDDYSDNPETLTILEKYTQTKGFTIHKHHLNKNYGEHKTHGKSLCSKEYVFQLDADELPTGELLEILKELLETNPETELFWLPRVNNFIGVNQDDAVQWGWKLSSLNSMTVVNWPDYQTRLCKNVPNISWKKALHERLTGEKVYTVLPDHPDYAIYHEKTIKKQIETNLKYNREFTQSENMGMG